MELNVSVWGQEIVSLCAVEKRRSVFVIPIEWHWRIQRALSYKIASWEGISGDGEAEREGSWLTSGPEWEQKHIPRTKQPHRHTLSFSSDHPCLPEPSIMYVTLARMIQDSSLGFRVHISATTSGRRRRSEVFLWSLDLFSRLWLVIPLVKVWFSRGYYKFLVKLTKCHSSTSAEQELQLQSYVHVDAFRRSKCRSERIHLSLGCTWDVWLKKNTRNASCADKPLGNDAGLHASQQS